MQRDAKGRFVEGRYKDYSGIKKNRLTFISSHPTWVRGLKYGITSYLPDFNRRTPHGCVD